MVSRAFAFSPRKIKTPVKVIRANPRLKLPWPSVIDRFSSRLRVSDMKTAIWIKRLGFWGFLFFLVKGLLWLLVPALAVYLTN